MSVALRSDSNEQSNKDAYDAEFDGDAVVSDLDENEGGPAVLCVDKETSCIYTY